MPSRQNVRRIPTPNDIMGDDAYIVMRDITVSEANEYRKQVIDLEKRIKPERLRLFKAYADENGLEVDKLDDTQKAIAISESDLVNDAETFYFNYFANYISDWNWPILDENGVELKPFGNPKAFQALTNREFEYIQSLFEKDEKETKN